MAIEAGALCYYLDPGRSWTLGEVREWDGKKGACKAQDGQGGAAKLTHDKIFVVREDCVDEDVSDLLHLTLLHDSTILACLRARYFKDVIYTNIGAIVIALNPFNFKIPHYMDSEMPKYLAEGERIERNIPHSWAQAHNTYYEMMGDLQNQTILVSGESGAGKTEASKIVFKYMAAVSSMRGTAEQKDAGGSVGRKINMTSPILESFGNAKTVRNDNSSRFGKFMRVKFSLDGFLVGAHITKYLLEKSRVVSAMPGERVYHAFYLICRGAEKARYGVGADKDFRSLRSGNTLQNKDFDTAEELTEVLDAMGTVGIPAEQVDGVWRVVGGILHSLNIGFDQEDEGSRLASGADQHVDAAVGCFGVDRATVVKELVTTEMEVMGQVITKTLKPVQATDGRDALCKALYDEQFGWLIEACNQVLDVPSDGAWVGLLDIFGFEDFEVNSFEQLCINLANETLQGHYNNYIFTKDMDECRMEGIDVTSVEFPDNAPCLNMLMGKGGVLALLDEQCMMGSGTDMGFLGAVETKHKKNPFFEKKALAKSSFLVHHYAGDVSYEVEGFLDKNRDTLKDAWKLLFRASPIAHVAGLLPEPVEKSGPKVTVGGYFKSQLGDLMELINSTNPHWIRCVKPHPAKKPLMLCGVETMKQLASAGVLGTVKIRKAGFPVRVRFGDFRRRYRPLLPASVPPDAEDRAASEAIVSGADIPPAQCQLGKTRVFMKTEGYIRLEQLKKERLALHAVIGQAYALAACAARQLQRQVNEQNKELIARLRASVVQLIRERRAEQERRAAVVAAEGEAFAQLAAAYEDAQERLWGELRRQAEQQRQQAVAGLGRREADARDQVECEEADQRQQLLHRLAQLAAADRKRREQAALRQEQREKEQALQRKQEVAAKARADALRREVDEARQAREASERRQREEAAARDRELEARIEAGRQRQLEAARRRDARDRAESARSRQAEAEAAQKARWLEYVSTRDALAREERAQEKALRSTIRAQGGCARAAALQQRQTLLAEQRLADDRIKAEHRQQELQRRQEIIQDAVRTGRLERGLIQQEVRQAEREELAARAADIREQERQRAAVEQAAQRERRRHSEDAFRRQAAARQEQLTRQREQEQVARALELQAIARRRREAAAAVRRSCSRSRSRGRSLSQPRAVSQSPPRGDSAPRPIAPGLLHRLMGSERTAAAGVLNDPNCREGLEDAPLSVERPLTHLRWRP